MVAVKGADIKYGFKAICDRVFKGETIIISRPKNENIVMLSEKKYQEFERLKKYAELYLEQQEKLERSFKSLKGSAGVPLDLDEIRKERLNL